MALLRNHKGGCGRRRQRGWQAPDHKTRAESHFRLLACFSQGRDVTRFA